MACHSPRFSSKSDDDLVDIMPSRLSALLADGEYLELACGNCGACRARRVRDWAIRSHHETLTHTRAVGRVEVPEGCFVTLTYSDQTLPPHSSLDHSDWQNFAKKLRRDVGPFRYLMCGEYGGKTHRPHYHACIFGIDFHEDRKVWKQNGNKTEWRSAKLESIWKKGFSSLAPLNFATASYVAGYVMKKLKTSEFEQEHHFYGSGFEPIFTKKPEYVIPSRNPGLGTKFFERYYHEIYPRDRVRIEGKEYIPPKFYDKLLLLHDPVLYDQVMEKRAEWLEDQPPTTDQELKARKANFEARCSQQKPRHQNADLLDS